MRSTPIDIVDEWGIWYDNFTHLDELETWPNKEEAFQYFQEDLVSWEAGEMDPDTPRPRFVCVQTLITYAD